MKKFWKQFKEHKHRPVILVLVFSLLLSSTYSLQAVYAAEEEVSDEGFVQYLSDSSDQLDSSGLVAATSLTDEDTDIYYEPTQPALDTITSTNAENDPNLELDTSIQAGRDYEGQILMNDLQGENYVLIGDAQQLRAIDAYEKSSSNTYSYADITGPIWKITYARKYSYLNSANAMTMISAELVYPGDADLVAGVETKKITYATLTRNSDNEITKITTLSSPETTSAIKDYSSYGLYGVLGYVDQQTTQMISATVTGNSWTSVVGATKTNQPKLGKHYAEEWHYQSAVLGLDSLWSTDVGATYVTGTLDAPDLDTTSYSLGSYDRANNYIIFRDIDLGMETENLNYLFDSSFDRSTLWTPLMYSGQMYGVEVCKGQTIRSVIPGDTYTNVGRPSISNVVVAQTGKIDQSEYIGIGFFATISDEVNVANIGVSSGTVHVENLQIENIVVGNWSTEMESSQTLVSGLTSTLGWLVGGLVDVVVGALSFGSIDLSLRDTLSALLNARSEDPTAFATGAFAGRVVGDVEITNCEVKNAKVGSVGNYIGGFVGYSEGETQYDGLSAVLGVTVDALSSILNIIPGLGLGDLITILLKNALPIGSLIPTGYINPVLTDCTVNNLSGLTGKLGMESSGSPTSKFVGGFVGRQTATRMFGCEIINSTYIIAAESYGGGFAGVARDADVQGLLKDIGIELIRIAQPQSLYVNCEIKNSTITVQGGNYLGGFAGVMANSYSVNSTLQGGSLTVDSTGSFAGGFTGLSTMGWTTSVGKEEAKENISLLSTVKDLLTGLLGDKDSQDKAQALLTLVGLTPSVIIGTQMSFNSIDIDAAGSYAGGLVGQGDAIVLGRSSAENLQEIPYWKYLKTNETGYPVKARDTIIFGLSSVEAQNYAGGIIAFSGTANVTGVLNGTLGVGDFKSFQLDNIYMAGIDGGYSVTAGNTTIDSNGESFTTANGSYAGGAVGMAIGGSVKNVTLDNIVSVSAGNYAAGFIACTYPGDVASSSGLNLTLLGIEILDLSNLLSLGAAIQVVMNDCNVYGVYKGTRSGLAVTATGQTGTTLEEIAASGFAAKASSTEVYDSNSYNVNYIDSPMTKGVSGGFIGISRSGGLADLGESETSILSLINANGLISAISYLIPYYENCTVHYVKQGLVQGDIAGGFAADFQSGKVNNKERGSNDWYAVYEIKKVVGNTYAGGFGGKIYSGAIAEAGKGLSILSTSSGSALNLKISAGDLVSIAQVYVPYVEYAGVKSGTTDEKEIRRGGFTVVASGSNTGKAGGFAGYTSGAQISYCDVDHLANTTVTPPEELEGKDGSNYFDSTLSSYSVTSDYMAGGYVGDMNIGSAASVGGDLQLLGTTIKLTDVADVLSVVVSIIEHSDVTGAAGGFSVLATTDDQLDGYAGGFAGRISGGHIQDSNSYNFSYIVSRRAAGGYVGQLEPGNIANVLGGSSSILNGLVDTQEALASIAEDFVPTIRNSETTCIPCGGAVRADAFSDTEVQRGMAGGYCGHNEGGQIWGNNTDEWKDENTGVTNPNTHVTNYSRGTYTGPQRECRVVRIQSVYGAEYAGGFTGLMECADTASVGNLSLLFGLVKIENLLGALSVVYPTEENTAVYGPLALLTVVEWNNWVDYVGRKGGYGAILAANGKVDTQEELDAIITKFIYGTYVAAGRDVYDNHVIVSDGGCAGGYVGAMHSGVITNGQAYSTKQVTGMKAAGGFAGDMVSGGVAELGTVSILGLDLNLGQTIDVLSVFVPTIKDSSVTGYRDGLTVYSQGAGNNSTGYAGGYVGSAKGSQIWGDGDMTDKVSDWDEKYNKKTDDSSGSAGGSDQTKTDEGIAALAENESEDSDQEEETVTVYPGCNVWNLRRVGGTNSIGGFVGMATAGSVANVSTNETSDGLLQKVLDNLISTPGDLVSALDATVTTIRCANVDADSDWGFVVDGEYETGQYAKYAGGFAGWLTATVIGERDNLAKTQTVSRLRGVDGGQYSGGFFGLADTGSVAEVGTTGSDGTNGTTILDLIYSGNVSVLDAFRTYIYSSMVSGCNEGISVFAENWISSGTMTTYMETGSAGGFGGGLMNGTVHDSSVVDLYQVEAPNYAAGFIGYLGKGGGIEANKVSVTGDSLLSNLLKLLGLDLDLSAQVLNVFGSTVERSSVSGISAGFTAKVTRSQTWGADTAAREYLTGSIAAGFAGYADVSQIEECKVTNLRKVESPQVAAGFVGRTSVAYLVDAAASSALLEVVLKVVDMVVQALYLDSENFSLLDITLIPGLLEIGLLSEGNAVYINLLGLQITVALSKNDADYEGKSDAAIITIGDSTIKLPCSEKGITKNEKGEYPELQVALIKGNKTRVSKSSVSGIITGYDVYGGGAGDNLDGDEEEYFGYAGGFVGYNNEGNFSNNRMWLCDVVRGSAGKVGPFTGNTVLNTTYGTYGYNLDSIEGNNNYFSVYRSYSENIAKAETARGVELSAATKDNLTDYNRYDILHRKYNVTDTDGNKTFEAYIDAKEKGSSGTSTYSRDLDLYVSSSMALLMLDSSTYADEPSEPETDEGEKPCEAELALTIQKKWKDWNNLSGIRPDEIKVHIIRSYTTTDEQGIEVTTSEDYQVLTMTKSENGSKWSSAWTDVEVLPVYEADSNGNILYYYTYTVEEEAVDGYTTTYSYSDDGYVATITNTHTPKIVSTGSTGTFWLMVAAVGMIVAASEYLQKK